jgi:hypothetical protein
MSRTERKKPLDRAPTPWPDVPSDDALGEDARQFALNLRTAIGPTSIRAAAASSDINHATLLRILSGEVWPDLETIVKLEIGLDAALWPGRVNPL